MTRRTLIATVLAGSLALTACSAPLPAPSPDPVPAAAQAAVTVEQMDRVLADLGEVIAAGDAALSVDLLAPRVTGPALILRGVEYRLQQAGDPAAVTAIPSAAQTVVVPATETWPRTVMVVTEPPADLQAPLLLTLVQATPRSPYQLWSWVRLFPGAQTPATAQPTAGSPEVPADGSTLAVPPADVVARYVDVLTQRDASPYASLFTADPLRSGIASTRDAFAALVGTNGTLVEAYTPGTEPVQVLGTADGGAIVVGTVQTATTISLADSTLTLADQTAALLGTNVVTTSLGIIWLSVVAFAVPPAGSTDPIQVLGAEHSRIQVTGG